MASALQQILYPGAVAIIGASNDRGKRGFRAIERLLADGFPGPIYPVNPRETEICGLRCHPSVADLPSGIDLALICTPAQTVPEVIRMCGDKGIRGAVVLAGGFAETGDAGRALQEQMVACARAGGVRIIGPNTSGMFNTHAACNVAGFANLRRGAIGVLSQSGNMALALVTEAQARGGSGLSIYVGVGNQADVQFHEYLDFFSEDPNTRVVVAYIEGVADGRAFLHALHRITRRKPVVIFKAGRTIAGRSSARSHTASLAGDHAMSEALLRQAGGIIVRKSDEILPVADVLSLSQPPAGRRIAVLADGGGHATIAVDALLEHALTPATLGADTIRQLRQLLPAAAVVTNPVDVAGGTDTNPALFAECTDVLMRDPQVDGVLIVGLYGGYGVRFSDALTGIELQTSERLAALQRAHGKPLLVYSLYAHLQGRMRPAPLSRLAETGIPVFHSLELAIRCLRALADHGEALRQAQAIPQQADPRPQAPQRGAAVIAACRRERRTAMLEPEARLVLAACGVPVPPARVAASAAEAVAAFRELGSQPVALKIISPGILHKSDAGGVALGLGDEAAVAAGFDEMFGRCHRAQPGAEIRGVLVAPMAEAGGVEVIVGMVRDPQFGPVMMFGLGGVLVELLKDVAFRALPVSAQDARAMLCEIAGAEILRGVRGTPPADTEALVGLICAVSECCCALPEIMELDLNPVRVYPHGLAVLDARMLLAAAEDATLAEGADAHAD